MRQNCISRIGLLLVLAGTVLASSAADDSSSFSKIREEGMERSQVMETLGYLTEVIGPRLTGSPALRRANDWTRETMAKWGLENARLEAWEFGRGWSAKRFSAQIVTPYQIPLIAAPKAWSPGLEKPVETEVIWLKPGDALEHYQGKLKGKIVLISPVREVQPRFEPLATRMSETNLLRLANAPTPSARRPGPQEYGPGERPAMRTGPADRITSNTNTTASASNRPNSGGFRSPARTLRFLMQEGAALAVTASPMGDGGTLFVSSASASEDISSNSPPAGRIWSTNPPPVLPQIALAVEDYNRIARMIEKGEHPVMAVEFQAAFHQDDLMAYNTVAELPGTDLKEEVVMLGAHLDSWHVGTGATDNAAGVAAVMEAVRILKALDLKPRRTIRVGLWSGEEQGLLGSRAYVRAHFGYHTNRSASPGVVESPKAESASKFRVAKSSPNTSRVLFKTKAYESFSAYYNLDNGAGRIRGIHLQGNETLRSLFRPWLEPFADLGASTITAANTGGTDHQSFDAIGLPGFQFIQDGLEYWSRTHHANQDVYERVLPEDLKQASTILAVFAYQTAMLDDLLPRKMLEE